MSGIVPNAWKGEALKITVKNLGFRTTASHMAIATKPAKLRLALSTLTYLILGVSIFLRSRLTGDGKHNAMTHLRFSVGILTDCNPPSHLGNRR